MVILKEIFVRKNPAVDKLKRKKKIVKEGKTSNQCVKCCQILKGL